MHSLSFSLCFFNVLFYFLCHKIQEFLVFQERKDVYFHYRYYQTDERNFISPRPLIDTKIQACPSMQIYIDSIPLLSFHYITNQFMNQLSHVSLVRCHILAKTLQKITRVFWISSFQTFEHTFLDENVTSISFHSIMTMTYYP